MGGVDVEALMAENAALKRQIREHTQRRRRAEERLHETQYDANTAQRRAVEEAREAREAELLRLEKAARREADELKLELSALHDAAQSSVQNLVLAQERVEQYEAQILQMEADGRALREQCAALEAKASAAECDVDATDRAILLAGHNEELERLMADFASVEQIAYDLKSAVDLLDISVEASQLKHVIEIVKQVASKLVETLEERRGE